jgi:hypothetical protein
MMAQFELAIGGREPATLTIGTDEYHMWTTWGARRGWDARFIRDGRVPLAVHPQGGGRSVEAVAPIHIARRGLLVRDLGLFWCRGVLGHPLSQVLPTSRHAAAGGGAAGEG